MWTDYDAGVYWRDFILALLRDALCEGLVSSPAQTQSQSRNPLKWLYIPLISPS